MTRGVTLISKFVPNERGFRKFAGLRITALRVVKDKLAVFWRKV